MTLPNTFALFISDLHLQATRPATTEAFLAFLKQHAKQAKQLYLMGDIFEYWAGDDDLTSPFPQQIVQALQRVSNQGIELFWIAGNRDFLVGEAFAKAANLTLLSDPHVFEYASKHVVLTHGDALCTDDVAYQQFRLQVRQPVWQQMFLAKPLEERKAIILALRKQSQQYQMQHSEAIMDVNSAAVLQLFGDSHASLMIHGHTHRPAIHRYGALHRYVLSDWNCDPEHGPRRGDWFALLENGELQRFNSIGQPVTETIIEQSS